jgi:RNA polymerase sigma factor (sigma-70 family)
VSTGVSAAGVTVEAGVERLYRREFEPMYRLAFAMLGSDTDADEVVQEAFVGVAKQWTSLESPGAYLRVSVVNGVRKKMRSQSRLDQAVASLSVVVPDTAPAEGEYLLDALDALPDRQRVAIVLTYFSGLRSSEVGELMECPAATVRSWLHRALEQLREVMDR